MQHIFNIAIDIEDERIAKSIEDSVSDRAFKIIADRIENFMCEKSYYGRVNNYKPLENLVVSRIDLILAENKDLVLEKAAEKIAEKLARSKDGKAILDKFKED